MPRMTIQSANGRAFIREERDGTWSLTVRGREYDRDATPVPHYGRPPIHWLAPYGGQVEYVRWLAEEDS